MCPYMPTFPGTMLLMLKHVNTGQFACPICYSRPPCGFGGHFAVLYGATTAMVHNGAVILVKNGPIQNIGHVEVQYAGFRDQMV